MVQAVILIEELSADEFEQLKSAGDGFCPDPQQSIALVYRENSEIVGRVFLVSPVHVEGPWVKPELRGSIIGSRLMMQAERVAKDKGVKRLLAYGADGTLADYLKRLGYSKLDLTVWSKEL